MLKKVSALEQREKDSEGRDVVLQYIRGVLPCSPICSDEASSFSECHYLQYHRKNDNLVDLIYWPSSAYVIRSR